MIINIEFYVLYMIKKGKGLRISVSDCYRVLHLPLPIDWNPEI